MNPRITIAMITFNVDAFIYKSMECVMNQTLKEISILCIDDGSTDNTPTILETLAANDHRITLIRHDMNKGLSVRRNEAIHIAKGEYIAFVDGDDLIAENLFEKALNKADETQAELVIWDYIPFWDEKEITAKKSKPSHLGNISNDDPISLLRLPAFSCIRLLKLSTAKKLNIHYPEELSRQDIPVHWKLSTHLSKVAFLPERLYYYRQHSNATTHQNGLKLLDLAKITDVIQQQLDHDQLFEKYKSEFLRLQLNLLYGMYDAIDPKLKEDAKKMTLNRLTKMHYDYLKDPTNDLPRHVRWYYEAIEGSSTASLKLKCWNFSRSVYRNTIKVIHRFIESIHFNNKTYGHI